MHPEKDAVMQLHTQAGSITTNLKVKVDFTLPALRAKTFVTWKCHVDESTKGGHDMILGKDIFNRIRIKFKILQTCHRS